MDGVVAPAGHRHHRNLAQPEGLLQTAVGAVLTQQLAGRAVDEAGPGGVVTVIVAVRTQQEAEQPARDLGQILLRTFAKAVVAVGGRAIGSG